MRIPMKTLFTVSTFALLLVFACHGNAQNMALPQLNEVGQDIRGRLTPDSFGTIMQDEFLWTTPPELTSQNVETDPSHPYYESQHTYDTLLQGGHYSQAISAAKDLVSESANNPYWHAHALADLGAAYFHQAEFSQALDSLRKSEAKLRSLVGPRHKSMDGLYAYLGVTLQQLGLHEEAMDMLSRAQAVTHIEDGASNLRQLKLIYAKAISAEAMQEWFDAEQLYRSAVKVTEDYYQDNYLETLDEKLTLAQWLTSVGRYKPALTEYRQMLEVLADADGQDTPAMLPVMRGMSRAYLLQQEWEVDRGLRLHKRIVELIARYPQSFDTDTQIQVLLDYGDWLMLFNKEDAAADQYALAWELAQTQPEKAELWNEYFSQPQMIYAGAPINMDALGWHKVDEFQFARFQFNVGAQGVPRRVRILDTNLHRTNRRMAIEIFRDARFRPALRAGKPVTTRKFEYYRDYPTNPPPEYGLVSFGGQRVRD